MRKREYSVIIFFSDGRPPAKYRKVTNLYNLSLYIERNLSFYWSAINVYDKESKQFIKQLKKGQFIPVQL